MYVAAVIKVFGISHMYQDRTKTSGNKGQKEEITWKEFNIYNGRTSLMIDVTVLLIE
jgi:hypothetical protein